MTKTSANDSAPQGGSSRLLRRLLFGFLIFVLLGAISMIVPASIPGELTLEQMTPHGAAVCQSCPPTEQIVAAGMIAGDSGWYLNVRTASPPFNTRLRISFAGIPGVLEVQQTGKTWNIPPAAGNGLPAVTGIAGSNNQVVLGFPDTLRTDGFLVQTDSGDHIPDTGFIEPQYPPAPHFNATDVVLLLILAAGAWYGYTRGLLIEMSDLVAVFCGILISALGERALVAVFPQILAYPRVGPAVVSCTLMMIITLFGFFVLPRFAARLRPSVASLGRGLDGTFGGVIGCVRQLGVLAMLLTAGVDLAVFQWANSSIQSSLIGAPLLHAWASIFSGT